jgi:hypothetical protein
MHVLRRLRRQRAVQRLPELRRRVRAATDPPGDRMAAGTVRRQAPPSAKRVSLSYSRDDIAAHSQRIRNIPPAQR